MYEKKNKRRDLKFFIIKNNNTKLLLLFLTCCSSNILIHKYNFFCKRLRLTKFVKITNYVELCYTLEFYA